MAKRYTEQFKKDALAYVQDHADLSVNACAKNLGIAASTLNGWIDKFQERGEVHRGSGNYSSDEAKENATLMSAGCYGF